MKKLYCVYDSVSETWAAPQVGNSDGDAARSFAFSCAAANVPSSYLKDIALYEIGSFDELTGAVNGTVPVVVVRGDSEFVRKYINFSVGGNSDEISEEKDRN